MGFKIAARTILHLGSELISSDGIALYELIKNSYDAGSRNVRVSVTHRLMRNAQRDVLLGLDDEASSRSLSTLKDEAIDGLIESVEGASEFKERIAAATDRSELKELVIAANYIVVADTGRGMTLKQLDAAFLTIGTRSKLDEKAQSADGGPILGEKGIGRLSAMRLGSKMRVETATAADVRWNILEIDWSRFSHASDALLDEIEITPYVNGEKSSGDVCGTNIEISGVHREWSKRHVEEIALRDFARLNDPLAKDVRFPIILKYNSESITIPRIEPWIFEHSHGQCAGELRTLASGSLYLSGTMKFGGIQEAFSYSEVQLLSASDATSIEILRAIGPFHVEFYWYNRGLLKAMDGIGDLATVRNRLAHWTGGLMLFRDGFRVLPYGNSDDDWLDLDRKALARSGFKINRAQLVGRVLISQRGNPQLKDQANREGLIDNEEKRAFQALLSHLVQQTFWSFITRMEKATKPPKEPVRQELVESRLATQEERLQNNLDLLMSKVPAVRHERGILLEIKQGMAEIHSVMADVRQLADEYQEGRSQLLNLAGVGMTVEVLAHELNRATETALDTLQTMPPGAANVPSRVLSTLAAQLKTLQKRLKILDPLSTAGRNRKEKIALRSFLQEVLESHSEQFAREGIELNFEVSPASNATITVTAVRGMIVQIIENLISNSVYWLRQQRRIDPDFRPQIQIVLDTSDGAITLSDNGPGISDSEAEKVFEPFFTTKPAGQGKGLGLFISREIAKYHKATLELDRGEDGVYRAFVLDLGDMI